MNNMVISGSYYDMGFKLGSQYKDSFEQPPCTPQKLNLARQCKEIANQYIPDLLEEIKGFCDGGNYDLEAIEAFLLVLGFELFNPQKGGCTVFCIGSKSSDSGFPIFARNYDWDVSFKPYFGVSFRHPMGNLKSVSFSDHMIGNYGGVNEEGLAIAILLAADFDGKWQPGIRCNMSTRWILDNCRTTEEAVSFLEKIPHVRGQIFMIMDKGDSIARVETSPPHLYVTRAKNDYLFTTNHYQADSLKKYTNPALIPPNSLVRFKNVRNFLKNRNKRISMNDIMKFLGSHEEGVCSHYEFEGIKGATIYSWIAEIREDSNPIQVLAAIGSPCENAYESLSYF